MNEEVRAGLALHRAARQLDARILREDLRRHQEAMVLHGRLTEARREALTELQHQIDSLAAAIVYLDRLIESETA